MPQVVLSWQSFDRTVGACHRKSCIEPEQVLSLRAIGKPDYVGHNQ